MLGYLRFQKVSVISRWFFLVLSPLFQGVVCNLTSFTNYLDKVVWVVTNFLTVTVLENKEKEKGGPTDIQQRCRMWMKKVAELSPLSTQTPTEPVL